MVNNAQALAAAFLAKDYHIVSGGTDNHLLLIDLRNKKVNGRVAAVALEQAGVVLNYNGVPGDEMPPFYASGIRLGTPAITTRGMKEAQMKKIAEWYERALAEVIGMEMPNAPEDKLKRQALLKEYTAQIVKNKKSSAGH